MDTQNAFSLLMDDEAPPKKVNNTKEKKAPAAKKQEPQREARPSSAAQGRGRSGRDNRRDGRGAGRPRREGKREFDRHQSGNGRTRESKRDGAGKYNWGKEGEEDRPRRERRRNDKEEKPESDEGDKEDATEAEETKPKVEEPEEEEDTTVDYDTYLASKEAVAEDNDRELREVDDSGAGFKSANVLEKAEEVNEYVIGSTKQPKRKNKNKSKGSKTINLFEFTPANGQQRNNGDRERRPRGGKGGKGDRRGKGGKGGNRPSNRGPRNGVNLNNEKDFPTL